MSVQLFEDHADVVIHQTAYKVVEKIDQKWNELGDWFASRFMNRLDGLTNPNDDGSQENDESISVLEISLDETPPTVTAKKASIASTTSSQGRQNRSEGTTSTPKRSARIQEKIRASMAVNGLNETKFMTPEAKMPNGRSSPVSTCSMASATNTASSSSSHYTAQLMNGVNSLPSVPPSKLKAPTSSTRSQRHVPRLLKPTSTSTNTGSAVKAGPPSASKNLTSSALKKKLDREATERVALIQQQIREKEEKALQQKQQFLENKVLEHKTKREEKERKVAMTREQMEKETAERRQRESAKKMAKEKKLRELEEVRKLMQKRAEEKELQDKKAAEEAARKAEEDERIRREQMEASEIRNKIAQLQHNKMSTSFLQHKAMTNSFMMKQQQSNQQTAMAVHQSLMSEMDETVDVQPTKKTAQVRNDHNSTFVKEKEVPPKLTSYDIGDLNSDGESDDERRPKNPVPDWAKGEAFVNALNVQFAKQKKHRERDVLKIFRLCPTTVDLEVIFKQYTRPVVPRYEKRTSSACWSSPPSNKLLNMSASFWANASFAPNMDTSVYIDP